MCRMLGVPTLRRPASPGAFSKALYLPFIALLVLPGRVHAQTSSVYYPGRAGAWESRRPEQVGMDAASLQKAVDFALANEFSGPRDLKIAIANSFEPDNTIVGPTKERGGPAGMVIKNGYIVAEWGDTRRVDMTFSVTKSYLSTIAGLALDDGLIRDVHDKVGTYVSDGTFASEHNAKITWHHLLTQSSDWNDSPRTGIRLPR